MPRGGEHALVIVRSEMWREQADGRQVQRPVGEEIQNPGHLREARAASIRR